MTGRPAGPAESCSFTPDLAEFDVVARGVPAIEPLTSFPDRSMDTLIVPAVFDRVQVESRNPSAEVQEFGVDTPEVAR